MLPSWATSTPTIVAVALVLTGLLIKIAALGVIPGNRKPTAGMAWLLLILISPGLGIVFFYFFGRTAVGRRRRDQQARANAVIAERLATEPTGAVPATDPLVHTIVVLNQRVGALPLVGPNEALFHTDYQASIEAMADAVGKAQKRVHCEFYITAWDEVTTPLFEAFEAATDRGVRVRLLFDHLGSHGIPGYPEMIHRLDATDIEWRAMLPIRPLKGEMRRPDLRNHRKILTVDGQVGFMGSQNLVEPGYNKPKNHALGRSWVELMVQVRGPVVTSLDAVFATDWYTEADEALPALPLDPATGRPAPEGRCDVMAQVLPSGPGYTTENNLRMFTSLLYSATSRISLTSPYFVPDESLLYAVTTASQRGVDVELMVSEISDQFMVGHAQASYYEALLRAGVRIYRYPAPFVLHSKHFTIDDRVAVVGSSNMDLRSFALNYEVSMMMLGEDAVAAIRAVEDRYRAMSSELSLQEWLTRPRRLRFVDNVMRLTSSLQ